MWTFLYLFHCWLGFSSWLFMLIYFVIRLRHREESLNQVVVRLFFMVLLLARKGHFGCSCLGFSIHLLQRPCPIDAPRIWISLLIFISRIFNKRSEGNLQQKIWGAGFQITFLLIYFRKFFNHNFWRFLFSTLPSRLRTRISRFVFSLRVIQRLLFRVTALRVADIQFRHHLLGFYKLLILHHNSLQLYDPKNIV